MCPWKRKKLGEKLKEIIPEIEPESTDSGSSTLPICYYRNPMFSNRKKFGRTVSWTWSSVSEGSSSDHFTTATATAQLIQSLNLTFLILISWRREKRLDKYSVNIFDAKKSRWHLRCKEFDWQDGILNLNYFLYLDDQNNDIVWGKSLNRTHILKDFFSLSGHQRDAEQA